MTRDEAAKVWADMLHPEGKPRWNPEEWSKKAIDCYVALGMLKLDEPKSVNDRLRDYMVDHAIIPSYADMLIKNIDAAGLKIVEK